MNWERSHLYQSLMPWRVWTTSFMPQQLRIGTTKPFPRTIRPFGRPTLMQRAIPKTANAVQQTATADPMSVRFWRHDMARQSHQASNEVQWSTSITIYFSVQFFSEDNGFAKNLYIHIVIYIIMYIYTYYRYHDIRDHLPDCWWTCSSVKTAAKATFRLHDPCCTLFRDAQGNFWCYWQAWCVVCHSRSPRSK